MFICLTVPNLDFVDDRVSLVSRGSMQCNDGAHCKVEGEKPGSNRMSNNFNSRINLSPNVDKVIQEKYSVQQQLLLLLIPELYMPRNTAVGVIKWKGNNNHNVMYEFVLL